MTSFLLFGLIVATAIPASAGLMEQDFADILAETSRSEYLTGLITLEDQVDLSGIEREIERSRLDTRASRHEYVIRTAQQLAATTQADLIGRLEQWKSEGRVRSYKTFWVMNAIVVEAKPEVFELIVSRDDVGWIFENKKAELRVLEDARDGEVPAPPRDELPNNLVCINLQPAWDMNLRGQGRVVASLDSGVDGTHEALGPRWRGHESGVFWWEAWFDPFNGTTFPEDARSHGSRVMGVICGEKPDGTPIGVVPEAKWIAAAATVNWDISKIVQSYEWVADPDGNPGTIDDVPDVVNNSWGYSTDCSNILWSYIDLVEAAGIVNVIAVDNQGPDPYTVNSPESRANSSTVNWGVGNVDSHDPSYPLYFNSGRGPSPCDSLSIKPNVTGPGTNVYSSDPLEPGGYDTSTGTSLAAPHISGACAILRQIDPDITVNDIKLILMETALDKGPAGPDNGYGWGIIDVGAAVDSLRNSLPRNPPEHLYVSSVLADAVTIEWSRPQIIHQSNPLLSYRIYRAPFGEDFPVDPIDEIVDPLGVVNYVDPGVPFDSLKYAVTAVYEVAESDTSNHAVVLEEVWFAPPSDLSIASVVDDTVTVNWERPGTLHPSNPPEGYRLFRALVGEEFPTEPIAEIADSIGVFVYVDSAVPFDSFKYTATTVYATAESDTADHALVLEEVWHAPPADLSASVAVDSVTVEWNRPEPLHPDNPPEEYRIFRALKGELFPVDPIASIPDTASVLAYLDLEVPPGTYEYAARTLYSHVVSDTSQHAVAIVFPRNPPENLTAAATEGDHVELQWERPSYVNPGNPLETYRIYRSPFDEEFGPDAIATIVDSSGVVAFVDSLVPFDSLRYAVSAVYQTAESDTSNHAVILEEDWIAPPTNLSIASVVIDTVTLEWERPQGIHSDNDLLNYHLFRTPFGDEFPAEPIATINDPLSVVAYIDSGVPFDSLRYTVKAIYEVSESDTSNHAFVVDETWMQPPPDLLITQVVADTVTLEWDRPPAVHPDNPLLNYRLFRAPLDSEFPVDPIATVVDPLGVITYLDPGVPFDSLKWTVTAVYDAAESDTSGNVAMVEEAWMSPPSGLGATVSVDTVRLEWERPVPIHPANPLLFYKVFRAPIGEEFGVDPIAVVLDGLETVAWVDSFVPPDSYHYVVSAMYSADESAPSYETTADVYHFDPPANLTFSSSADSVTLQWDRPEAVDDGNPLLLYRIYRALLGEEFGDLPLAEVADSSQTVAQIDAGVPFADHHYVVTALYANTESAPSNEVTVLEEHWTSPPRDLDFSVVVDTVSLQWSRPSSIHPENPLQLYRVFRAPLGEEFGVDPIATVTDPGTSVAYIDSGVPFADHHYAVTALYSSAESDTSNNVDVTELVWSTPPTNLTVTSVVSDTVTLQWERPEPIHPDNGLLQYRIYRAIIGEEFSISPLEVIVDPLDTITFVDEGVPYDGHHYAVTAVYEAMESDYSNDVEVPVDTWSPAPGDLIAWVNSDTVSLQWNRPVPLHPGNLLSIYKIFRAIDDEPFPPSPIDYVVDGNDVVLYQDVDTDYETYRYMVTAQYQYGQSGPSNEVEVIVWNPQDVDDLGGRLELSLRIAPNPFNPSTTIHYTSTGTEPLRITIYTVSGARVRTLTDTRYPAVGEQAVVWNGTDQKGRPVASGAYLIRIEQARKSISRRLILLK